MPLDLNNLGYFEARGLNVLAFSNWYDDNFSDAKISGIELIDHEVRTATNEAASSCSDRDSRE